MGSEPLYALVDLAGTKRLLLLDQAGEKATFYDRLYFDTDGDGDLTDAPPLKGLPGPDRPGAKMANFPPLELTLDGDGPGRPYCFTVRAYQRTLPLLSRIVRRRATGSANPAGKPAAAAAKPQTSVYLAPHCYLAGRFDWAGKTYRVMVGDTNGDGIFGNAPQENGPTRMRPDACFLTANKTFSYQDMVGLDGPLCLGGKMINLKVHPEKGSLTLAPLAGPTGTLRLPMATEKLQLSCEGRQEDDHPDRTPKGDGSTGRHLPARGLSGAAQR